MKSKKSEGFLQGVISLMFSQIIVKILGMVYSLYLTNKRGFGDKRKCYLYFKLSNICNFSNNIINRYTKCNFKNCS